MAGHWITVLEGVVATPSRQVSELPLLGANAVREELPWLG